MEPLERISVHDQFAGDYDRQVQEYHCFAADVLFGLAFEYIQPGERLLDIGIGTGLSASPFIKAGLHVFGMDASAEMLKICRSKNTAISLKQFDIRNQPLPYGDGSIDHVVSCGVLHFFGDLDCIFAQVARVIQTGGTFAFTTKVPPIIGHGNVEETTGAVTVFTHSRAYIDTCVARHNFIMRKSLPFYVTNKSAGDGDLFCGFVVQRSG